MARLEELRRRYEGVAEFAYLYIQEAHPENEWQTDSNREAGVVYRQPTTDAERMELARTFVSQMGVETLTLVDDIRNTANACYAAWPERIYVIDTDGRIVHKGGVGPFFFDPEQIVEVLRERFGAG